MQERNPPRNSQLEAHPDDERMRRQRWRPHRVNRFPDALKNSYREAPRSGSLILRGEVGLEFRRWHVAERGVEPFFVVDRFQEVADLRTSLRADRGNRYGTPLRI